MLGLKKNGDLEILYHNLVKKIVIKKSAINKDDQLLVKTDYRKKYEYLYQVLVSSKLMTIKKLLFIDPIQFDKKVTSPADSESLIALYKIISAKDEFKDIVYKMGIKSCPYCNRNYIEVINRRNGGKRRTSQIDHFLSKSKYPIYSVSFYNLIPVCSVCNHTKGSEELSINPYLKNHTDMRFSIRLHGSSYYLESSFDITLNGTTCDAQVLDIEELYQLHKNVVATMLLKKRIYSTSIIDSLSSSLRSIGYDENRLKNIIFGMVDEEELLDEPLSKLKFDIFQIINDF